jgi:predicted aconitase with swiveling domain
MFGYSYIARSGKAPKTLLRNRPLGQTAAGGLPKNTPMIYGFDKDIVAALNTGDIVRVDTDKGEVEVIKEGA